MLNLQALLYPLISPSRLRLRHKNDGANEISAQLKPVQAFHRQLQGNDDTLALIGHGAGSFRYYPMRIVSQAKPEQAPDGVAATATIAGNGALFAAAEAKPVAQLMEQAFKQYGLDAIELDVQILLDDDRGRSDLAGVANTACILHDPILPDKLAYPSPAYDYLRENTLSKLLETFVAQGYHQDKLLYLDLKSDACCQVSPSRAPDSCKVYPDLLAEVIKPYLSDAFASNHGKPWLRVVSFSPHSLFALRDVLDSEQQRHLNFGLIAGYENNLPWPLSIIKRKAANAKGPVPLLDDEILEFAASCEWLNQLWFSCKGLSKPVAIFQQLNQRRLAAMLSPLSYSVSHYDVSERHYRRKLSQLAAKQPLDIASFMIDIDQA